MELFTGLLCLHKYKLLLVQKCQNCFRLLEPIIRAHQPEQMLKHRAKVLHQMEMLYTIKCSSFVHLQYLHEQSIYKYNLYIKLVYPIYIQMFVYCYLLNRWRCDWVLYAGCSLNRDLLMWWTRCRRDSWLGPDLQWTLRYMTIALIWALMGYVAANAVIKNMNSNLV